MASSAMIGRLFFSAHPSRPRRSADVPRQVNNPNINANIIDQVVDGHSRFEKGTVVVLGIGHEAGIPKTLGYNRFPARRRRLNLAFVPVRKDGFSRQIDQFNVKRIVAVELGCLSGGLDCGCGGRLLGAGKAEKPKRERKAHVA